MSAPSAGLLRLLRRFISSGAWAQDVPPSSGSSDSSVLSASTVESLVHQRIRGGDVEPPSPREDVASPAAVGGAQAGEAAGDDDTLELRREMEASERRAHSSGFGQGSKTTRLQSRRPGEVDSDDALPPQVPGCPREDAMLSHKLCQLSRRKECAMRRVVQESAAQGR